MQSDLFALVLAALVPHLILGGAGVDRVLVGLPARRRLGSVAYAQYACATDLGNGLILYPLLGIGGPLLTWAALALALRQRAPAPVLRPLAAASVLCVLHTVTTSQAAATMLRVGRSRDQETELAPLLDRFAAWSLPRAVLQALTAAALLWALDAW